MSRAVRLSDLPPAVRAKVVPRGRRTKNKVLAALRAAQAETIRASFLRMLDAANLPHPTPEFRFHDKRRWRFDYAWPPFKIALEVEGGIWIQGRHSRGAGMVEDMAKYNTAATMGWRVLRTTPDKLTAPGTEEMLRRVLRGSP